MGDNYKRIPRLRPMIGKVLVSRAIGEVKIHIENNGVLSRGELTKLSPSAARKESLRWQII